MANKKKVLYIDDEQPNLFLFELTFRNDLEVITSESAEDGLLQLESNEDISAVFTDFRMPGMNGIQFVERAKEIKANVPYYVITGFGQLDEIDEAIKANLVTNYLNKPFDKDQLLQLVS